MAQKAKIEGVIRRVTISPDGRFVEIYEIPFITPSGIRDKVEIPVKEYTPEAARKLVDEKAAMHEELMKG